MIFRFLALVYLSVLLDYTVICNICEKVETGSLMLVRGISSVG